MIQHIWTVVCRAHVVDPQTNNISLIDVLEEISVAPEGGQAQANVRQFPAIFSVVSLWVRENPARPDAGQASVRLLSPAGDSLAESIAEVDLREFRRMRVLGQFVGFPLAGAGTYHFAVATRADTNAQWAEVARVPLDVAVEQAAAPARAGGEAERRQETVG